MSDEQKHNCRVSCDSEYPVAHPLNKNFKSKGRDPLLGKSESKAAESCVDIMFNGDKNYESGMYFLKKGSKIFKVYCD